MTAKMQLIIWIAHPILESVLAGIMVKRKMHRQFPVFFTYILCQIVTFAILFPIYEKGPKYYDAYFYAYWLGAAVSLAIGFKVIHEIVLTVFRPYHALKDLATVLFRWAALVMLLVALVVAASSPTSTNSPITQSVTTSERCVRVIQCGLILFLLVFSKYLGISWRQPSFGIALGFGGYASVELASFALYAGGQLHARYLNILHPSAYLIAIATWIAYALLTTQEREEPNRLLVSQRWEQGLSDLQGRDVPPDSLIPMFESMVERAFSKAPGNGEVAEKYAPTSDSTRTSKAASAGHEP